MDRAMSPKVERVCWLLIILALAVCCSFVATMDADTLRDLKRMHAVETQF